jgi:hypothetical protein
MTQSITVIEISKVNCCAIVKPVNSEFRGSLPISLKSVCFGNATTSRLQLYSSSSPSQPFSFLPTSIPSYLEDERHPASPYFSRQEQQRNASATSPSSSPRPITELRLPHLRARHQITMPPCATTGTTWVICGHSIYQHQPSCKRASSRCTKRSTIQPGLCPSCTQLDFYSSAAPPQLPSLARASDSEPMTPVKIKKEPVDENENSALVKMEQPMDPDEYLRSEYEKHKKALTERALVGKSGNGNASSEGSGVNGLLGGAIKEEKNGKEYSLEFHIKQLEAKLEQAELREAEKNVEIGNLQTQVGMLRDPPTQRGYVMTMSAATLSTSMDEFANTAESPFKQVAGPEERELLLRAMDAERIRTNGAQVLDRFQQERKLAQQQIEVREQIRANRAAAGGQAQVSGQGHGNSQVQANAQPHPHPHTNNGNAAANIDWRLRVEREKAEQQLSRQQSQENGGQECNGNQHNSQVQLDAQAQAHDNDQVQVSGQQRQVTPEFGGSKEKLLHIAAITFTAPMVTKVANLKSALASPRLEVWFDKQIKYTFECAGEPDFGKMVKGFRDFVDFVGVELQTSEEKMGNVEVMKALRECEEFVQVVVDVEYLLSE